MLWLALGRPRGLYPWRGPGTSCEPTELAKDEWRRSWVHSDASGPPLALLPRDGIPPARLGICCSSATPDPSLRLPLPSSPGKDTASRGSCGMWKGGTGTWAPWPSVNLLRDASAVAAACGRRPELSAGLARDAAAAAASGRRSEPSVVLVPVAAACGSRPTPSNGSVRDAAAVSRRRLRASLALASDDAAASWCGSIPNVGLVRDASAASGRRSKPSVTVVKDVAPAVAGSVGRCELPAGLERVARTASGCAPRPSVAPSLP